MNEAIKPDFFFNKLTSLQVSDNEAGKKGATDEERALYALAQMKGWHILKDVIETLNKDLDNVNKEAIANGSPLEEIGRNAIVISMVKEVIERILNKVADATEACTTNEQ